MQNFGFQGGQAPAIPQNLLAQLVAQQGTTQAIPDVQRSQILANALANLEQSGGQNLRTAGALGSNLLADALLEYSRGKNDQSLRGDLAKGQTAALNAGLLPGETAAPDITPQQPIGGGGIFGGARHLLGLDGGQSQTQSSAATNAANPTVNGLPADIAAAGYQPPSDLMGAPPAGGSATTTANAGATADPTQVSTNGGPQIAPSGSFTPITVGMVSGVPTTDHPLATALRGSDPAPPPASPQNSILGHVLAHYTAEGYSPAAASGLAGGFTAESRLDPNATNGAEGAVGIGQWRGPRLDDLKAFAASRGTPLTDLDTQLAFSDKELGGSEGRARTALLGAQTPDQGAAASNMYERPAGYRPGGDPAQVSNWSARDAAAQQAFAQLSHPQSPASGQQIAAAAPPAPTSGASGGDDQPYQVAALGMPPGPPQQAGQGAPVQAPSPQDPQPPVGSLPWQMAHLATQGTRAMVPPVGYPGQDAAPPGSGGGGGGQGGGNGQGGGQPPSGGQGPAQPPANDQIGTPAPIQPWQIQRANQLRAQAAANPRMMQAYQDYHASLVKQSETGEEFDASRPNDAGQVTLTGKISGRQWIRQPNGVVVSAGPRMTMGQDANGQPNATPVQGTQWVTVPGGPPNVIHQVNQATGEDRYAQNPGYGPVGANTAMGADGQLHPVALGATAGAGGGAAFDPKAPIPPALQGQAADLAEKFRNGKGYTDYVNSLNAENALEANIAANGGNNSVLSQAGVDNTLKAMTGLSARQGSVNSLLDHLPWPDELKGQISKMMGGSFLDPEVFSQLRTTVHAYRQGHEALARQEYGQYNGLAHRSGFDLGLDLPRASPPANASWLPPAGGSPPANPGAPPAGHAAAPPASDPLSQARQAISRGANPAAVRARLQQMGVNPAGL